MKPSIEIPKLDPAIPEKTVSDLQKLEDSIYQTPQKNSNGICTSVMTTTTFGIFGLSDELFSYREFFVQTYGKKFEIPASSSAPHIFTVEGASHKMTKEQLSSPILQAFESVKRIADNINSMYTY